jgi:hypothetical protein
MTFTDLREHCDMEYRYLGIENESSVNKKEGICRCFDHSFLSSPFLHIFSFHLALVPAKCTLTQFSPFLSQTYFFASSRVIGREERRCCQVETAKTQD